MSVIRRHSLVEQVYDQVRRQVIGGSVAPGSPLNIAELAKQFGVSPTPVREALAKLSAENHVQFVANVGYRVADPPSAGDYTEWAIARIVVESNALRYILGPLDSRLLDEAHAINERIRITDFGHELGGVRRFSELNWRFHASLIALARNKMLTDLHARLYAAPQFGRIFLGRGILNQAHVVEEHRRVLKQLRSGDYEAASLAMRDHIVESLERDARMSDVSVSLRRVTNERTETSTVSALATTKTKRMKRRITR